MNTSIDLNAGSRTAPAQEEVEDSEALRNLMKILSFTEGYVILSVLIGGIIGNVISIVVFWRTRRRRDATVQYLSVLSVSDLAELITYGVLTSWLTSGLNQVTHGEYSVNLWLMSNVSCKLLPFLSHVFECFSAWTIVAFSIERAVIVWFPLKRLSIIPKKRKILISTLLLLSVAVSIQRLVLFEVYFNHFYICFYLVPSFTRVVLYQIDVILYNYIPSCLIFISNILILIGIGRSKIDKTEKITKSATQDLRVILSLLSVSTLFVIFLTPASAAWTYYALALRAPVVDAKFVRFLQYLGKFLAQISHLNYCINFIIYGCTLPFFRDELKKMFNIF
ncbi:neuropeptide SIFamide receptor-like [Lineus longissimus]|uniref:neuropeptide SIFamide receptor-like n=1 Tax=Lineus longissimus TaxID=88925 RepID=UPI00315CE893